MVYKNMRLCFAIGKYCLRCRVKRTAPIKVIFTGLEIKQRMLISLLCSTVETAWKAKCAKELFLNRTNENLW